MSWPPSRALRLVVPEARRSAEWEAGPRRADAAKRRSARRLRHWGPARRDAGGSAAAGVAGVGVGELLQGGEGRGQRGPLLGGERRQPVGQTDPALVPQPLHRRMARWLDP